ncbi:hypothetical protein V8C86DRAFT_998399 [Haematococcus lacustris]
MVWTTAAKCSLLALLLAACCPTNAQFAEDGGDLAVPFCNSAGKTLSCGWASESEQKSSIKTCIFCGSVWGGGIKSVPTTLELGSSAFKLLSRVISLGCSGPVVVRTEFKVLSSTDGCSRLLTDYLGSQARGTSSVTRCELRGSSDVNCKSCNSCAECPLVEGQSYSDTFRTNVPGCRGVLGTGKIEPAVATILMNPDTKIQLNKFDVRRG